LKPVPAAAGDFPGGDARLALAVQRGECPQRNNRVDCPGAFHIGETSRRDTHHGERLPLDADEFPERRWAGAEVALPAGIAQYSNGAILGRNTAADHRVNRHGGRKILARQKRRPRKQRTLRFQREHRQILPGEHTAKRSLVRPDLLKIRIGKTGSMPGTVHGRQTYQAIGVSSGQRAQGNGV